MKLILMPLTIMLILVVLSQMGMGSTAYDFGTGDFRAGGGTVSDYYYDLDGNPKMNSTSLVPVDPDEDITIIMAQYGSVAMFYNDTDLIHTYYVLYYDTGALHPVPYRYLGQGGASSSGGSVIGVTIEDSLVFIGVCVGVIAFSAVIGIQIFGSGENSVSIYIIIMFTGLLSFWAILSLGAISLITSIPNFGAILYVVLTLMYTVGTFQMVSGGGSE